jgi:hypothetical protein
MNTSCKEKRNKENRFPTGHLQYNVVERKIVVVGSGIS